MKMKYMKHLLVLIMVFNIQGCSLNDDCGECMTPPAAFVFDFVDKDSGLNLFFTDTYQFEDLKIIDQSDNSEIPFNKFILNDAHLIGFNTIGWESESVEYHFFIDNQLVLTLSVVAERVTEDCCTYTNFVEVKLEQSEYQLDNSEGIFRVFVDL